MAANSAAWWSPGRGGSLGDVAGAISDGGGGGGSV